MPESLWVPLLTEHGPWAVMVFYLLFRDQQKDRATAETLNQNSVILAEIGTVLKERLPRGGGGRP